MTGAKEVVRAPLFRRHTRRPRLTVLLDEARAQSLLLTAPAGYGKTTLAREWLQGRADVVWYRATPASADIGAFSIGLAETVAPLVPGAGERVRRRLRVGDASERLARPLAELLAEDLEPWPEGGIVVLDDYHFLAESATVEEFLDWLLMLAPIRLLVATRRRPAWATARRFLYGEAVEIGRDELAMTDEEAGRVLADRSSESVRALVRQAGGWPAVIGLAALSSDLAFPAQKVSQSLFRYFAEEVLRREPEPVQRFMLLASVPSSLDSRLAREVLGLPEPEPIIARLREEDLLQPGPRNELRFHPLLREFLRTRLQADEPDTFAEKARLLVEDAFAHERWEEAFALSVESGRLQRAAEIAGRAARALLATGQSETLEKWLTACGAAGVTVPAAALARAELLVRKGEMTAAAALGRETAARLSPEDPDHAWAHNLTGRALHFTSEEDAALASFQAARRAAKTTVDLKDALWGLVLTATEVAPETMAAYLDEFEATDPNDIDVRLRVAMGRYGIAEQTDSIAGEWQRLAGLLTWLEYSTDPLAASSFLAVSAEAANLRGSYAVGLDLAERALSLCRELRVDFGVGVCLAYKAVAEIGLRRNADARRSLQMFRRSSIQREDPYFRIEGLNIEARLLATIGATDEALKTMDELPTTRVPRRAFGAYLATMSIILAGRGDAQAARELADKASRTGSSIETRYCTLLAAAIAEDIEGASEAFRISSTNAVVRCGRADYLDGLVFAYRVHPRLLEAARENDEALSVLRIALRMGRDQALGRRAQIDLGPTTRDDPIGGLTEREVEVLGLLSQGMTNAEIAKNLYIARSTAKVHVRNILRKLGAKNRLQAVIRAQEFIGTENS